jgi:hypothetical protein
MESRKILCLGVDEDLLTTRCAVLVSEGYECVFAIAPEGLADIEKGNYDLVIFSSTLAAQSENLLKLVPKGKAVVIIRQFIRPEELLVEVETRFSLPKIVQSWRQTT